MTIEDGDFAYFQQLKESGIPITLHCEHQSFGVNFANPDNHEKNTSAIRFVLQLADRLESEFIVVHPGVKENNECSIQNTIDTLKQFNDKRLIIENMPLFGFLGKGKSPEFFGVSVEEMKELLSKTGRNMCLDFGHAVVKAFDTGEDYIQLVKRFMEFQPVYFHISDNEGSHDTHTNLGEGVLDLSAFKSMVGNHHIAIETKVNLEKQVNDIRMFKEL